MLTDSATVEIAYQPNDAETYHVEVTVPCTYPDAVNEARAVANRAIRELVGDVIDTYAKVAEKDG